VDHPDVVQQSGIGWTHASDSRGVAELLTLVEFDGHVTRDNFDWKVIEKSLGLRLPVAYKELVEILPPGRFQDFVQVIRPGDVTGSRDEFLGYYAYRLDDMRAWREEEPSRFPMPIFPEPGGLLPWGTSKRAGLFFWLTDGEDPSIIGPARPEMTPLDWGPIENQLGFGLPSDYKSFIDTYGPGTFGDITITNPVSGRDDSLDRLIEKIHAEASANPRRQPEQDPPIHPEPEGMIPWGETDDGWACCWAPSTANPDDWGIVRLAPAQVACEYSPGVSFTAFLVEYATSNKISIFRDREEPPSSITFTPR
jgi:SUKH superfamily protein